MVAALVATGVYFFTQRPDDGPQSRLTTAEELLGVLPDALPSCEEREDLVDTDAIAVADCVDDVDEFPMGVASFYLHPDPTTMEAADAAAIEANGLTDGGTGPGCEAGEEGVTDWYDQGVAAGTLTCSFVSGKAVILWSDDRYLIRGVLISRSDSAADMTGLFEWWRANHAFGTG
jgi:hypothetical protein